MKSEELKNTQLRRLNKVLHNGVVKTIDCISPGYVTFLEDRQNSCDFGEWVSLDEVYFLELTEEILLKCGFKHKGNGFYEILGYFIELCNVGDVYYHCGFKGKSIGDIKHLHQLQNIYYALTNQELEIN